MIVQLNLVEEMIMAMAGCFAECAIMMVVVGLSVYSCLTMPEAAPN